MKIKGNLLFKETLQKYPFPSASHVFFTYFSRILQSAQSFFVKKILFPGLHLS